MRLETISYMTCLLLLLLFVNIGECRVIVYDDISTKGEKIFLKAESNGRFFKKGGKLIEFFYGNKSLGKRLSGGDGFALMEFTPTITGILKIKARVVDSKEETEGILLSLNKGKSIILIEVEKVLYKNIFNKEPVKDSLKGVKELSKRYPIVYIYSDFTDIEKIKEWLKSHSYPEYPVMNIKNGSLISEIIEKGLKIKAIICSSNLLEFIKEYKINAYSFESSDYAQEVDNWDEILKMIK